MQHMFFIQLVNVFSGNQVNFAVPVLVQGFELSQLLILPGGKLREIFSDEFQVAEPGYGKDALKVNELKVQEANKRPFPLIG
jgi:hypothetical protein